MPKPRILITEDEMLIALDLQQRLLRLGYDAPPAVASGEEAINKAKCWRPDLLLMDVHLQGELDGIETVEKIRAFCDVPVIYITANSDSNTWNRARDGQASSYLLKPFRERELQISIEMALSNHALECQLRQAYEQLEARVEQRTAELAAANVALQTEVHERQQAEQAASEWKRRYDLVVAASGQAVYELDAAGGPVIWSAGVERVLGHSAAELCRSAEQGTSFIHPEDRDAVLAAVRTAREQGSPYSLYYRFQHGSGHYLWIHDRGFQTRDDQGRVLRTLGVMHDVTHPKLAEDKIREQAALLDKTQDAIMVRDLEHRVLYWNASSERVYGWTVEEACGRPIHELLLKGEKTHLAAAHEAALANDEWAGEIKVFTRSGEQRIVQSRWTLLRDDQDRPRAFLVVHTDLTEQKQLEARYLRAQRLESIGALASGIAHDLNNVFTPVLMAAQFLDGRVDPGSQNMLDLLQTSARRGSDMVKQILSFSRGIDSKVGIVQVKHLVREMERMARDTFPKTIRIRVGVTTSLWPIKGDSTPLYQVLMNLCINARDAMPEGGVLTMEAENFEVDENTARQHPGASPGPHIVITVSDTGTGMPPEVLERIFEPFFTTKEPGKGTGLGLPTVLTVIKSHHGWIDVTSRVGSGSDFRIYLPAEATAGTPPESEMPEALQGEGQLLLVVDDEASIREILKTTLEAHGYDVLLAGNGAEAVARYSEHPEEISIVLTDVSMPVMDGVTAVRAIRKLDPAARFLLLSGLAQEDELSRLTIEEGLPLLPKPYSTRGLLAAIHRILNSTPNPDLISCSGSS